MAGGFLLHRGVAAASGAWVLWHGFHWPPLASLPVLLGMGVSATPAQLAMTRGYKEGHVLIVGSLSYSTVAFTSLAGIALWGEWLAATPIEKEDHA